jgi:6-phosphofructokinase 1
MPLPQPEALVVARLGDGAFPSPLSLCGERFVDEGNRVLACADTAALQPFLDAGQVPPAFELAGPRSQIFFAPENLTCGIVTCGGLCPGQNNVIRSIVLTLIYAYGVSRIVGFRYGYAGLASSSGFAPIMLTLEVVDTIHEHGGTLLGSSRGPQDVGDMVDTLVKWNVGVLFAIGGDGTLRGASALHQEITRRGLQISVIGVPKTIDNDLEWIEHSFGFATAVEAADNALVAAHAEARGAWNGVGLVKLMGRNSGFIAAHTSLANCDVNFCLVPEVPFRLEGEGGFLHALEQRLDRKHHAVVVVAEGAGQDVFQMPHRLAYDASGNVRYQDIGGFLCDQIARHFAARCKAVTIKYIDPSYIIRGIPANSVDSEYCLLLGQHAVHAGMAGRTDMVVGYWNQHFTHIPIGIAVARRKQIDPEGDVWQRVLEATGQPADMRGAAIT